MSKLSEHNINDQPVIARWSRDTTLAPNHSSRYQLASKLYCKTSPRSAGIEPTITNILPHRKYEILLSDTANTTYRNRRFLKPFSSSVDQDGHHSTRLSGPPIPRPDPTVVRESGVTPAQLVLPRSASQLNPDEPATPSSLTDQALPTDWPSLPPSPQPRDLLADRPQQRGARMLQRLLPHNSRGLKELCLLTQLEAAI